MEDVIPVEVSSASSLARAIEALRNARDDDARLAWLENSDKPAATRIASLVDAASATSGPRLRVRRLLWILRRLALRVSRPDLAAAADYALARRFALAGRLHAGLALLERARRGWSDCGHSLSALRTNLGRMQLLTDLGEYTSAIAAGRALLDGLRHFEGSTAHVELSGLAWLNIAACENSRGRFQRALSALRRAESHLAIGEHKLDLARARNNRGIALKELGHLDEALACFRAAKAGACEDPLLAAQLTVSEGKVYLLNGGYSQALARFDQARSELAELRTPVVQADAICAIAEAYLSLNLFPEAHTVYEQLLPFVTRHEVTDIKAQAMLGKARVLAGLRRDRKAIEAYRDTLSLAREMGNNYLLLLAVTQCANLLAAGGKRRAARELLDREAVAPVGAPQTAMLALTRARLAASTRSAQSFLDQAAAALDEAPLPFLRKELLTRKGAQRLAENRPEAALAALSEAVRLTERLRRGISHEPLLRTFFDDKIEPYYLLLEAHLATGKPDQALAAAEQAKARTLADFQPGPQSRRDDLPWLELSHVQQKLLEAETPVNLREQKHALLRAERLLGLRLLEQATAAPAKPSPHADIAWPEHPVLVYSQTQDTLVYFLCMQGEVVHSESLCSVDTLIKLLVDLRDHMDRVGRSPLLRQRHGGRMRDHARRLLSELHTTVFADVDTKLGHPPRQRLTVVPHGLLAMLPFPALYDGNGWLVERYCVTQAPALSFLKRYDRKWEPEGSAATVAAAGGVSIPGVSTEVEAVSGVLSAVGVEVNMLKQARVQDVFDAQATPDILHLACHGRFRSDNPMFSGLRLADRWVTAAELMERVCHGGRLAVLSACESGRADWLPGNEPLGLPRAFLSAGYQSVLTSLWLADDQVSVALNRRFYEAFSQSRDAGRALQTAQCDINCDYDDPFFWAGYVLMERQ